MNEAQRRGAVSRWAAVAFAWVGYLVFARSMIYFIAFVGGFGVAKTVDGPPHDAAATGGVPVALSGDAMVDLLVNLALVAAFVVHHSIFARPVVKRVVQRALGDLERSLYVWASSLLIVLLMWAWRPVPGRIWSIDTEPWRAVAWIGFGVGWGLALLSSFRLGHTETFGVREVVRRARGRAFEPRGVETRAMYSVVRHPMELGFLLGMWLGPEMSVGRCLLAGTMTLYVAVGHRWEERELGRRYGSEYARYAERTPAFLPSWRRRVTDEGSVATDD